MSVSPGDTQAALGGLFVGLASMFGALLVGRYRSVTSSLLAAVAVTFTACAAYGIAKTHFGDDTVLGLARRGTVGVTGFFWNCSHMAAGAAVGACAALGLLLALTKGRGWVRWTSAGALVACILLLVSAIPLTNSRMGLATGVAGLVSFGLLAARATRWPMAGRLAIGVMFVAAVAGGARYSMVAVPELRSRFELGLTTEGFMDIRFPAWESTVALASRYPVAGTGLGTFETAIHETQSPRNPDELVHAHSEPLQILSELGVIGALLVGVLLCSLLRSTLGASMDRDRRTRFLACGAGAATAALLFGSLTEFHFHIPGLALSVSVLAVLPEAMRTAEQPAEERRSPVPLLVVLGIASIIGLVMVRSGVIRAERGGAVVRALRGGDVEGATRLGEEAISEGWSTPGLQRRTAGALVDVASRGGSSTKLERAEELALAVRSDDPFNAWSHWTLARVRMTQERRESALVSLRRAHSRAGGIGHLQYVIGVAIHTLAISDEDRQVSLAALRAASETDPDLHTRTFRFLDSQGVSLRERMPAVAHRWYGWTAVRNRAIAAEEWDLAVQASARLARISPNHGARRDECLSLARRHGLEQMALDILESPK